MKPEPVLETLSEKKLIGKRITMSFAHNKTSELWRSFMPARKEIRNNIGTDLFSLQLFDPNYFENFDQNAEFEKWAAIEVTDFERVPEGMESLTLKGGLYAVFNYKGRASEGAPMFQYIYGTWVPNSGYMLDDRPHFEILGEKYKNEDPDSEETIWIPIRLRI